jgi:hypothetical protein
MARARRAVLTTLGAAVPLVAIAVVISYPRQIVSHLTHWKGGPRTRAPSPRDEPPPQVRIAVAGDIGHAGSSLDATGAAIACLGASRRYDALLLLGDHAYPRGDPSGLRRTVFEPFARVLDQGTRLLAVLGNHDVLDGHRDAQLRALGQRGRWWAEELDDLLLVGLDSNPPVPDEQFDFLEDTLATSTARWRIVALHHPPYSAGYQGSHLPTRARFAPIFARHRVDIVLSAHDHDYQRSVPIDGVVYVVTGGAARARFTGTRAFTAQSFRVRHFVEVTASGNNLTVRGIDQRGRVFDELLLTRARTTTVVRDCGVHAS